MVKKWILPEDSADIRIDDLASELKIPKVLAQILVRRDILSTKDAKKFFSPNLNKLHDPFLMKNMDSAVERIQDALKNREKIMVHGDYDVDGITACSLLYLYFKEITDSVHFYIPERLREGYGFSEKAIDKAKRLGTKLIITVDCGITSVSEISKAKEYGIDVIVTDHHQPGESLPDAYAILNPMQKDCKYPFKGLSGVGVAFKLVQALDASIGRDITHLIQYTDLVAIGSSADIVPLVDENRVLVKTGLERINTRQNIGLNALLNVASLHNTFIGTGQILFGIAPRINAAGRMGNAERGVNLFAANNAAKATEIAQILESENDARKKIESETFDEAFAIAEKEFHPGSADPIVLYRNGWHSGVIGIVASRLVDRFFRPVVMIAVENGIGKGSIRSIPEFDVYSAVKKCAEYLTGFGGHKLAAGLTIEEKNLPSFKEAFKRAVNETITTEALIPKLTIDARISLDSIDDKLYSILRHFAPFGPKNSRPVFLSEGATVVGTPSVVGKNHLKFSVKQNGTVLPAIGFNLADKIDRLNNGRSNIEIAFAIDENTWRGNTTLQLQIKDIRTS